MSDIQDDDLNIVLLPSREALRGVVSTGSEQEVQHPATLPYLSAPRIFPGVSEFPDNTVLVFREPVRIPFWLTGLVGGLGALLGWILVFYLFPKQQFFYIPYKYALGPGIFAAAIPGALIGLTVGCFNGGFVQRWLKSLARGFISMFFCLVGGGLSGIIVQVLFDLGHYSLMDNSFTLTLIRAVSWACVGLTLGLTVAVTTGSGAKMVAGMLGGLIGGLIGGLFYGNLDVFGLIESQSSAVTVVILGIGIGLAIGLAKDAPYIPKLPKRRF